MGDRRVRTRLSRNGSATSMLNALQFWCRGRWPQGSIHIRHAAIALAIIVSTDAETHRAAPAFALVDRSLLRVRPSGGSSDSWVESSVISPLIFRDSWLI